MHFICAVARGGWISHTKASGMRSGWARTFLERWRKELASVKRSGILKGELGIGKKRKDCSFDESRKKFEAWAEANKKPGTVKSYKECLRRLSESFSGKRLGELSPFLVEKHKQARIQAGARVRANRELAVLKSLFNRCQEWQLFEGDNPVATVKMLKEPRQRLRFLEPEEEHTLLDVVHEPLRSIIILGIHCGLRVRSEALTLRWKDIDLARRTLTVQAAYAKKRSDPLRSVKLHGPGRPRTAPENRRVCVCKARRNPVYFCPQ
jgi:integrase